MAHRPDPTPATKRLRTTRSGKDEHSDTVSLQGSTRATGMTLNQIETFIHVVEHGSFSKAALVLGVAQPALSRQVRVLETELRTTLLLRNGRGVTPTEAGQRLLEHGQGILHLVAQAREDLVSQRDEPLGDIVVAMPPTLARLHTLRLIEAFKSECPKARLAVTEGFSAHLTEWLSSGRADLGLAYNPEPLPSLEILPLREDRLCLVSAAGQAPQGSVNLHTLSGLPLVMPQRGHTFRRLVEGAAAMAGVHLQIAWEVSSVPAILDLVARGFGHAALAEDAVLAYEHPERLALSRLQGGDIRATLCLVTPAARRATPLMERTAAILKRLVQGAPVTPFATGSARAALKARTTQRTRSPR